MRLSVRLISVSIWKGKVERLISKGKKYFLRMLWGTESYCWFYLKRSSFAMVLLRTVPLASWLPHRAEDDLWELLYIYNPGSPTPLDTTAFKVPRADLVSGSESRLSLLSALTPHVLGWPVVSQKTFCPTLIAWFEADFISLNVLERKSAWGGLRQ